MSGSGSIAHGSNEIVGRSGRHLLLGGAVASGHTKVDDIQGVAMGADSIAKVGRLDVSMNHTVAVKTFETLQGLVGNVKGLVGTEIKDWI